MKTKSQTVVKSLEMMPSGNSLQNRSVRNYLISRVVKAISSQFKAFQAQKNNLSPKMALETHKNCDSRPRLALAKICPTNSKEGFACTGPVSVPYSVTIVKINRSIGWAAAGLIFLACA